MKPESIELNGILARMPVPLRTSGIYHAKLPAVRGKNLNLVTNFKLVQIPIYTFEEFLPSSMYLLYNTWCIFAPARPNY